MTFHELTIAASNLLGDGDLVNCRSPDASQARSSISEASSNDTAATADLIKTSQQLLAAHLNGDDTTTFTFVKKKGIMKGSSTSLKPPRSPAAQDVSNVVDTNTRQLPQHSIADNDSSSIATSEYDDKGGCGGLIPTVGVNNSTGSYSTLTNSHSIDTERYAPNDPFAPENENIRRSILSNVQAQRSKRRKVIGLGVLLICLLAGGTVLAASMGIISVGSDDNNKNVDDVSEELGYVEPVNDTDVEYEEEPVVEYVCDEETGQYVVVSTSTNSSVVEEEEEDLELPEGITPSLLLEVINTPGFTIDMISNYHEFGTLPPGITENMVVKMLPEGVALESLREVTPEMIMKVQEEQSEGGGDVVDLNYRRNLRTVNGISGRRVALPRKRTSVRRRRGSSVSGRERALEGKSAKGAKLAIAGTYIDPEEIEGVYLFGSKCTKSPSISSQTPAEYASGLLEALEESKQDGGVIVGMPIASVVEPVMTDEPSAKPTLKPITSSPTTAQPTTASPTTAKPTIAPTVPIVIEKVLQEEVMASMSMLQIEEEEAGWDWVMGTVDNAFEPLDRDGEVEEKEEEVMQITKDEPSPEPTSTSPTVEPSKSPSIGPSKSPSVAPTTKSPSLSPTVEPTTKSPSLSPSMKPTTNSPSLSPSMKPTTKPTKQPTPEPSTFIPEPIISPQPSTLEPTYEPTDGMFACGNLDEDGIMCPMDTTCVYLPFFRQRFCF